MNFIASLLGFSTTTGHQDKNNSETPKPSHHLLEIINNQTIPNNTHMESKILNKNPTNEGLTLPAASRVTESITRSPTLAPEKTPENKAVLTLKEVEGTLQIYRSTLHEIKDKATKLAEFHTTETNKYLDKDPVKLRNIGREI